MKTSFLFNSKLNFNSMAMKPMKATCACVLLRLHRVREGQIEDEQIYRSFQHDTQTQNTLQPLW